MVAWCCVREGGTDRVVGARRGQLVRQFLFESSLVNLIALVLALLIVELLFPYFRDLVGRNITLSLFAKPLFWMALAMLFLGGSLMAGLYPAFVTNQRTFPYTW